MMICTKCRVLCDGACPVCNSNRHLREVQEDEPVRVMALTAIQSMLVEPILEENAIPYYKKGMLGDALMGQAGLPGERFRYYVPYAAYAQCRACVEAVFGEDPEIMASLHEFDEMTEKGE